SRSNKSAQSFLKLPAGDQHCVSEVGEWKVWKDPDEEKDKQDDTKNQTLLSNASSDKLGQSGEVLVDPAKLEETVSDLQSQQSNHSSHGSQDSYTKKGLKKSNTSGDLVMDMNIDELLSDGDRGHRQSDYSYDADHQDNQQTLQKKLSMQQKLANAQKTAYSQRSTTPPFENQQQLQQGFNNQYNGFQDQSFDIDEQSPLGKLMRLRGKPLNYSQGNNQSNLYNNTNQQYPQNYDPESIKQLDLFSRLTTNQNLKPDKPAIDITRKVKPLNLNMAMKDDPQQQYNQNQINLQKQRELERIQYEDEREKIQQQRERERLEYEQENEKRKQRVAQLELEKLKRENEMLNRQAKKQFLDQYDDPRYQEQERLKQLERQRQQQIDEERENEREQLRREFERQRQIDQQREEEYIQHQKELEAERQRKLEYQRQREIEYQREREIQRQRQIEQMEYERQQEIEFERQREEEFERQQRLIDQERIRERQLEIERQREREFQLQKQREIEEIEEQREMERQRQIDYERKEELRKLRLNDELLESERQRDIRQREKQTTPVKKQQYDVEERSYRPSPKQLDRDYVSTRSQDIPSTRSYDIPSARSQDSPSKRSSKSFKKEQDYSDDDDERSHGPVSKVQNNHNYENQKNKVRKSPMLKRETDSFSTFMSADSVNEGSVSDSVQSKNDVDVIIRLNVPESEGLNMPSTIDIKSFGTKESIKEKKSQQVKSKDKIFDIQTPSDSITVIKD
ncbi:MAG: hypothetical protein EZS28_024743, partial [Streblomastix strix]